MTAENQNDSLGGINRRLKPRYAVDIKVEMLTKGLDHYVVERCANVSLGGIFVCTDYSAEMDERVHVRIILSDKDAYFDLKTKVAWICDDSGSHPKGLGLQFVEISTEQQIIIDKILRDYVNVQSD
ncbi:PilZ domain-containing protein [bacterium]|nr:PilZ domain-containing protein [bacterium]